MAKYVKVDGMKLDYSRLVYIPPNDGLAIAKFFADQISNLPAADVAPVVRCKDCKYSKSPSKLTILYGKPGTLTCCYGPCNRRNVNENDFCSYGAKMEREA